MIRRLWLKCPLCSGTQMSPFNMTLESFEAATIGGSCVHTCVWCSRPFSYDKTDLRFGRVRTGTEGPA